MTGTLTLRGSCYGYPVHSDLALRYTREGVPSPPAAADAPLEVVVDELSSDAAGTMIHEWLPPRFPTHIRLHRDGEGYRIWVDGAGWFAVDPSEPRIVVPPNADPLRREERLWGLPSLLCFLARGDVPLHAACVEVDGRALVLTAPRRFGKSTLAAAFAAAGHRILAEDLVCLRPGPVPEVLPGPAMLRLRADVADSFPVPGARELRRDDERAHLALEENPGSSEPVPLAGIAFLGEGDAEPRLDPVDRADAVRDLWAVSFNLPTDEDRARSFQAVADVASSTRLWRATRRLRLEDLPATVERLVEEIAGVDALTADSPPASGRVLENP